MATVIGDVMAPNGEYTTQDGQQKTRWMKCGILLQTDKGMRIKLECMPVSGFDGWLQVFEKKDDAPKQQGFREPAKSDSSDVPF